MHIGLMMNNGDFSELPTDILSLIIRKLFCPSDLVWFGAVCVNWRSALVQNPDKHFKSPSSLPVLLFTASPSSSIEEDVDKENQQQQPHDENGKNITTRRRRRLYSYSLYDGKFHDLQLQFSGSFHGSNHGWLVEATGGNHNYSLKLLNPFLSVNNKIQLPPKTIFKRNNPGATRSRSLRKAVISASPSSSSSNRDNNVVVMVIHGSNSRTLSFCKPGDKAWTVVPFGWNKSVDDVIFYKGLFYSILETGLVLTIEVPVADHLDIPPKINVIVDPLAPPLPDGDYWQSYLVESSGELLKVMRERMWIMEYDSFCTIRFRIFKLAAVAVAVDGHDHISDCSTTTSTDGSNNCNEKYRWVETKSLDGCSLILSYNACVSLSASHISEFPGICEPNCIYFTDACFSMFTYNKNIEIYHLEDMSFKTFQLEKDIIPPSLIWIHPTL